MSSSTHTPKSTYHLYTFYASSCAARLRIAFNLKNIDYVPHYVDMNTDDHESEAYCAINPSAAIPTRTFHPACNSKSPMTSDE